MCIPMVTKDHHLIRFNLPIYGAIDIIDGLLLLVVVDLDEGLAEGKERMCSSIHSAITLAVINC